MLKGNLSNYTALKAGYGFGNFPWSCSWTVPCSAGACEYTIRPTERALHVCIIHMLTYTLRRVRQENLLLCHCADNELLSFCPVLPDPAATPPSCLTQALTLCA